MNNRGQFSMIAALLVSAVLITTVITTYSMIRDSLDKEQPEALNAVDEINFAIKQILGFTVGYYGSVLKVTGNVTDAYNRTLSYVYSGLKHLADLHPEWGTSISLIPPLEANAHWYTNESYSSGRMLVNYNLTKLGIRGIIYEPTCKLDVQVINGSPNGKVCLNVTKDESESLMNLRKQNFKFYQFTANSAWELVNPNTEPSFENGAYYIEVPSGIDEKSFTVQVEDSRGIIAIASSFNRYTITPTWNSTLGPTEHYVDKDTTNVDGYTNKGTHSNFTAQQYGPDSVFDTLTEARTRGYRVQQGDFLFQGTDAYIPLNYGVNITHAFVIMPNLMWQENVTAGDLTDGDPAINDDNAFATGYLHNSTHIRVQRWSSSDGDLRIGWQVLECFNGEFSVQRGEKFLSSFDGQTTTDAVPTPVDPTRSMAWHYWRTSYTGRDGRVSQFYSEVTGNTAITFRRQSTTSVTGYLRWTVIEWDNSRIGHFAQGYATGYGDYTSPFISSIGTTINESQSLLIFQTHAIGDDGLDTSTTAGYILNNTHVAFYNFNCQYNRGIKWYVIDFGSGVGSRYDVDHSAWGSTDYVNDDPLASPVRLNRTLAWLSGTCDGDGIAKPRHTQWWFLNPTNSTHSDSIHYERRYGGQPREIAWEILELPYSSTNYELDLEIQWTNVNYNRDNEELCVKTGSFSADAESIMVDVWNGSAWINIIASLSPNNWNNVSVNSHLTSRTFTIRFRDNTQTSDGTQSYWQIDAVLLHLWPAEDLYSMSKDVTIVVELLQNGTIRWLGQNLLAQTKPIPPLPVKAIHVNQTIEGIDQQTPFQIEDWASEYRIPLGLTSNASLFNSRTMLVFQASPNVSKITIWWNGSDKAVQTPYSMYNPNTSPFKNDDPDNGFLSNGLLNLSINNQVLRIISKTGNMNSTTEFTRINNEPSTYGSAPSYVIHHGIVRDVVQTEPEWNGGAGGNNTSCTCPDLYAHIVITLPANATFFTCTSRIMFLNSTQTIMMRKLSDLSILSLAATGLPQPSRYPLTENGTQISNNTGIFYNYTGLEWAHHWSQIANSTIPNTIKGTGIMFTDSTNLQMYCFDNETSKTGGLNVSSTDKIIELAPVKRCETQDFRAQQLDITWHCAIATFDATTPVYTEKNGSGIGLWLTVVHPPTITVTTEN